MTGWSARWRERLSRENISDTKRQEAMRAVNPACIPRNHLVEEVIKAATETGDFAPFEKLLAILATPYEDVPNKYCSPPRPDQVVHRTFCGT